MRGGRAIPARAFCAHSVCRADTSTLAEDDEDDRRLGELVRGAGNDRLPGVVEDDRRLGELVRGAGNDRLPEDDRPGVAEDDRRLGELVRGAGNNIGEGLRLGVCPDDNGDELTFDVPWLL